MRRVSTCDVYRCAMVNRSWIKIPKEQTKPLRDHAIVTIGSVDACMLFFHVTFLLVIAVNCNSLCIFWIFRDWRGSVHWVTE